jgi:hypothetical protein
VRQYIGAVGARLKPVAGKIGAGRAKFELVVCYASPGIASRWFYRAISFNGPASGTRQFFCRDSALNHPFVNFIVFCQRVQLANATINTTGGDHAQTVSECI